MTDPPRLKYVTDDGTVTYLDISKTHRAFKLIDEAQLHATDVHGAPVLGNDTPPDEQALLRHVHHAVTRTRKRAPGAVTMQTVSDKYPHAPDYAPDLSVLDLMHWITIDFAHLAKRMGHPVPSGKPLIVYMQAGQHAREWLSQAVFFSFIELLLREVHDVLELKRAPSEPRPLSRYVFHLVPLVNVQGFHVSIQQHGKRNDDGTGYFAHRYQRKPTVRHAHEKDDLERADLNRNWKFIFGWLGGSSADPSAQDFRGPHAESELEVRALAYLVRELRPVFGLDIHSYGNLILPFPSLDLKHVLEDAAADEHHKRQAGFLMTYGGERIKYNHHVADRLCKFLPGFKNGSNADLGYDTSGACSDWLNWEGALGYTIEIGSGDSDFDKDGPRGYAHQVAVPQQMLEFFLDDETRAAFDGWVSLRRPRSKKEEQERAKLQ